ncbi:MAG: hypothetical protein H8E14_15030 [Candidatus Marinimicrobia bacterium]|nr:hypothetical protein [Candidatus Neomarinimicrobiota bacterium]
MKKTIFIIIILLIFSPSDYVMGWGGKLKKARAELETCNQEKASIQVVLDETVQKLNGVINEKDGLLFQQKVLKSEITRLKSELADAPFEEFEAIKKKYTELEEVKNRVITMLDERVTLKDQALNQLKIQKEGLESQITSVQRELERLRVENQTLQSKVGKSAN